MPWRPVLARFLDKTVADILQRRRKFEHRARPFWTQHFLIRPTSPLILTFLSEKELRNGNERMARFGGTPNLGAQEIGERDLLL